MQIPNDKVQAVIVSTKELFTITGHDIHHFFLELGVDLLEITEDRLFGESSIVLLLEGKEQNVKKSLLRLKKFIRLKEFGAEFYPIKEVPKNLQNYLLDIENASRFEKLFNFCTKEYLDDCIKNNIQPHPEVLESLDLK